MLRSGALGSLLCALVGSAAAQPVDAGDEEEDSAGDAAPALGAYERDALEVALAARGLRPHPAPAGKLLRRIHVVNLPVFGQGEGFLRWFNVFHRTTRERIIEREVLLVPGQPWDPELVEETRRRLRDPLFTSLVVVAPVLVEDAPDGAAEGAADQVDLLVVTRDIWSLRMNSRYEFQESVLSELSLSLSENNLLGLRKQVALVFDMDLGAFTLGPQYVDKNIAGTRLQLVAKADAVFSRETSELEGSQSVMSFGYPLWSYDRPWAASVVASHFDAVRRSFQGPELRTYDNPDTDEVEAIPYEFGERDLNVRSTVTRQLGPRWLKHRIAAGHELSVQRPRVLDDFPGDAVAQAAFERDVMPRSERASSLFTGYSLLTPRFRSYRNINSYDLTEDRQLGPELSVEVGLARTIFGSEANFSYSVASASWTFDLAGDGILRLATGAQTRLEDGELIDNLVSSSLTGATPALSGFRLAARASWARLYNETNNRFFTVGGDSGLRGYSINDFAGQIRLITNLEMRTPPIRILFTRAGAVLFWDMGHAADCYSGCPNPLNVHHDIGAGARLLIPQLQPVVFRFDWAFPLTGPRDALPGRFTAGIQQAF